MIPPRPKALRHLQRRKLLSLLASSAAFPSLSACAAFTEGAREPGIHREAANVLITVDRAGPAATLGPDFVGFSYEKSALSRGFFVESNKRLVDLFHRLGPGILRLGGNSVDRTSWSADNAD